MLLRVVFDTNQIVGAGSSWLVHGKPDPDPNIHRRVLIHVAEHHQGLYSGKLVGEYLEKLVDRNHPPGRAVQLMAYIMGAFERVEITTTMAPVRPTDLDDEVFLLCALDGSADYLISEDHSLTDLVGHYSKPIIGRCAALAAVLGA